MSKTNYLLTIKCPNKPGIVAPVAGATAHYVTADLDEGPIIEQDLERISHQDKPEDLVRKGRDIERRVLARAVAFHLDGRVFACGKKTVVFRD